MRDSIYRSVELMPTSDRRLRNLSSFLFAHPVVTDRAWPQSREGHGPPKITSPADVSRTVVAARARTSGTAVIYGRHRKHRRRELESRRGRHKGLVLSCRSVIA